MRPVASALAGTVLVLTLSGCVPPAPAESPSSAPVGPTAPTTGPLTLQRIAGIVGAGDASATMTFSPDGTVSSSGEDLASETDYWVAVGGRPEACADVVSAPYVVSRADAAAAARLDDPSALLGTFTELDEGRFGLIQVYARQFDDAATAAGFLDAFATTVDGCPAYQLVDDGQITYDAVGLSVSRPAATADVAALVLEESLGDSPQHRTVLHLLQREGIVLAVYGEVFPTSTIVLDDVERIAGDLALRLAVL